MPTPAYIDTALYQPLGGINGFELNGYDINGVGYTGSPFAGVTFELDPFRSVFHAQPQQNFLERLFPSLLSTENNLSLERAETREAQFTHIAYPAEMVAESRSSQMASEVISLTDESEHSSVVPVEYRTAYVPATHPTSSKSEGTTSEVAAILPSEKVEQVEVSVVPKEYRSVTVRRGDS